MHVYSRSCWDILRLIPHETPVSPIRSSHRLLEASVARMVLRNVICHDTKRWAHSFAHFINYSPKSMAYHLSFFTSSTRTRRGGSCLKNIYKAFLIYRTCMRRAPAKPCVRALCESGVLFHMSHLKLHFALHSPRFTLPTALFPLHTPHFTLHSPHFTLHTWNFTVHTSHFSLLFHIPHFTLHSSRPTLHTALFTRHTLSHLSSSHLIPSHFFSSHHLFSYVMQAFMNHFPVLLLRNLHAPCASQARACVLCAKLLQCCCPRRWPARDPGAMQTLSSQFTLHSSHPTLHTSHLHFISTHLIWALLISFHVFPYVS